MTGGEDSNVALNWILCTTGLAAKGRCKTLQDAAPSPLKS